MPPRSSFWSVLWRSPFGENCNSLESPVAKLGRCHLVEVQPLRTNISAERRQEFATLVDDTVRRIESGRLRTKTTSATSSMRVIQE